MTVIEEFVCLSVSAFNSLNVMDYMSTRLI